MILVDTSVWIDHFRTMEPALADALNRGEVMTHPLVIGELACGNLRNRSVILGLLDRLPKAPEATHAEILEFVEARMLIGRGLGLIDVHLLASAVLAKGVELWTRDKHLDSIARSLEIAH